jgi:hypothetical protein
MFPCKKSECNIPLVSIEPEISRDATDPRFDIGFTVEVRVTVVVNILRSVDVVVEGAVITDVVVEFVEGVVIVDVVVAVVVEVDVVVEEVEVVDVVVKVKPLAVTVPPGVVTLTVPLAPVSTTAVICVVESA